MKFNYQQTQAELTYRLVGIDDWAFKKVAALGSDETNAGPENARFLAHRTEMDDAGWTLVSMAAIAGTIKTHSSLNFVVSQTSNYQLSWKRPMSAQELLLMTAQETLLV